MSDAGAALVDKARRKEKRQSLECALIGLSRHSYSKALEILFKAMTDKQLIRAGDLLIKKMPK